MEDFLQDPYDEKPVANYSSAGKKSHADGLGDGRGRSQAPIQGSSSNMRRVNAEVPDFSGFSAASDAYSSLNYASHIGSPQNPGVNYTAQMGSPQTQNINYTSQISSPQNPKVNYSSQIGSPQNHAVTADPIMDQLNFLGSPLQQTNSIDQSLSADIFSDIFDPRFKDSMFGLEQDDINELGPKQDSEKQASEQTRGEASENLKFQENLSENPRFSDNFSDNLSENMFLSSQYFSPNNRGNFSSLNAIAEDAMPAQNTITPNISRHGSISVQPPHELTSSYLSPKKFMSPSSNAYEGSFDTLRSPYSGSYSGSYLNSPPPMMLNQMNQIQVNQGNQMNQINQPIVNNQIGINQAITVSPQVGQVPEQSHLQSRRTSDAGTKQLTQEEKIKRRREFHNAVERRRRDLIKEKIKALGLLVPPALLTPQLCAVQAFSSSDVEKTMELSEILANIKIKEAKPNKAIILRESVVYIRHLQKVSEEQRKRRQELESMISVLESERGNSSTAKKDDFSDFQSKPKKEEDFLNDIFDT